MVDICISVTNKLIINQILGKQYLAPKNFFKNANQQVYPRIYIFIYLLTFGNLRLPGNRSKFCGLLPFSHMLDFSRLMFRKKKKNIISSLKLVVAFLEI